MVTGEIDLSIGAIEGMGSVIAAIVPVGIAAAFSNFNLKNAEEPAQAWLAHLRRILQDAA